MMATQKPWIERVYHPYWDWEEIDFNMWGNVDDKDKYLKWAIEFTGDAELYGSYMMDVAREWTKSCQHNLSNRTQNRKAWIGHAACAKAYGCPEHIVRQAWSHLSEEQQIAANKKADEAIEYWEQENAKDRTGN
jgi:hypothetical protein